MADSSLQDLNKMKVIDLKKELKMRGLDTVGKRNELIERLNASLDSTGNEIDLSTESEDYMNDVLNVSEELDFEFEEDENVFENEENTSIARTDDQKIPRANERKLSESSDDSNVTKGTPRKIIFNKILSVNNSENKPESTTEETSTKQEKEAVTAVGTAECKRVIKLSNISAKERLEMRAKKFGTILIADQKKEARFVRFEDQVDTDIETLRKRAERFGTSVSPILSALDRLEKRKARFGAVDGPAKKDPFV